MKTTPNIPCGFCQCGCGHRTKIAHVNDRSKGWVKGEPFRFIRGHAPRLMRGDASPQWKGGRSTSSQGYAVITQEDGSRAYEHILLAERALGRKLKYFGPGHPDNEVVHHVYGVKDRNQRGDLLICTHAYHTALHHRLEQSREWPEFPPIARRGFKGQK